MIIAENLKKTFETKINEGFMKKSKKHVEAVKEVSLKIDSGEIIGLLGINGAGKTTTIKMLTTLLSPTSGTYLIDNIDGVKNPRSVKKIINMVAGGERMIYWRLTAYENLWYYGQLYGIDNKLLKERINMLLKLVGLYEKKNVPVETYSKGMKQRLQIARGLINDPKYIFMDEPTIGLDAVVAKELREYTKRLAKEEGKGILLTSHYMGEIEELCDYIYILNNGETIKEGTPKELTRATFKYKKYVINVYNPPEFLRDKLSLELNKVYDDITVEKRDTEGLEVISPINISINLSEFCVKNGLIIKEMYEIEPKLEEAIINLAKEA